MNEAWAKLGDEATLNLQKKYIDKSLDRLFR